MNLWWHPVLYLTTGLSESVCPVNLHVFQFGATLGVSPSEMVSPRAARPPPPPLDATAYNSYVPSLPYIAQFGNSCFECNKDRFRALRAKIKNKQCSYQLLAVSIPRLDLV